VNSSKFRERLLERIRRADLILPSPALDALEAYYNLLTHWNKRINLTSLPLEPMTERSLERLIVEPLTAASYVEDGPINWFDLGSGGGSPAIPLKIARPRTRLTLVESRSRKAAFLREAARELQLTDAHVIADRFENLVSTTPQSTVEMITARAVRLDSELLSAVSSMLIPAGRLLFFGADAAPPDDSPLVLRETVDLHIDGTSKLVIFIKPQQR
jgi:16S rRNA (guanine527-N7)-methyltransferase